MKLRTKVLIIIASVWVIISLSLYFGAKVTLTQKFLKLENAEVLSDIARMQQAFDTVKRSLGLLSNDWGQWNDMYAFMEKQNDKFITDNMAQPTFENAKINLIVFFDTRGQFYYGKYYRLTKKDYEPMPHKTIQVLQDAQVLNKISINHPLETGILKTDLGYLVFSASAILKSDGTGPMRGTVLMGYFLKPRHIQALSEIVRLPLIFYPLPLPANSAPLAVQAEQKLQGVAHTVFTDSGKQMAYGFMRINDANNKPVAMLRMATPRTLYNQGIHTVRYYLLMVIVLGIIVLSSLWYMLKLFVLDRLISVSSQVVSINMQSRFAGRIKISGNDELAEMVSALNSLLEIIELTEEQLKSRVMQRTEKLERLLQLNQNLFGDLNRQKAVEAQLRRDEKLLRQMAYYDELTGLPNRMFFNELLRKSLQRCESTGAGLAVMFIDADRFKQINDAHGHDMGDRFLRHVANQLKLVIKDSDVAARHAGDEFLVFLPNIKEKSVINLVAEKILKAITVALCVGDVEITVAFSIGISLYPENGNTVEELEKSADLAMYYAKRQNGNVYSYASPTETHTTE